MAEYSIGLDLGGTNLRGAAIDRSGSILEKIAGKTRLSAGKEALLDEMAAVISSLKDRWGAGGLAGIGVGVPGFILLKEGVIKNSNNLPFLENIPDSRRNGAAPGQPASFWRTTPTPRRWVKNGWAPGAGWTTWCCSRSAPASAAA